MSSPPRRALRVPLLLAGVVLVAALALLLAAEGGGRQRPPVRVASASLPPVGAVPAPTPPTSPPAPPSVQRAPRPALRGVARDPSAVDVLVNKRVRLPAGYRPPGLVVPNVPFTFSGFDEKRQLRRVAARPLERLFAAAAADGVPLAGVSGYRSETTQRSLFGLYVSRMGLAAALRVSARPGHSEHETGLAIDLAGADGACLASACFAGTPAAKWLAAHSVRYGFVVRYPAGGERSTGYSYEPWHLRYLGRARAAAVAASGLTYEQFLAAGAAGPR